MEIKCCELFGGKPYVLEKNGKYHVLQGSFSADDVQKWYDTEEEAIKQWNIRAGVLNG